MVQTVGTYLILSGGKKIVLEKPNILHRIFFFIRVLAAQAEWYDVKVSLGDPLFRSYYSLNGPEKYFKAKGVDIFQGDIWILNATNTDLWSTATEILSSP